MLSRSDSSLGSRTTATLSRRNPDDPNSVTIRYDYSATYTENNELEAELEDKTQFLQWSKYRASIEGEESLKKAKQNAEELLSLKEKVNKRDPNESSNKLCKVKIYDESKTDKAFDIMRKSKTDSNHNGTDKDDADSDLDDVFDGTGHMTDQDSKPSKPKPLNTLTNFVLAFQKFKVSSVVKDHAVEHTAQTQEGKPTHMTQAQTHRNSVTNNGSSIPHPANADKMHCFQRKLSTPFIENKKGTAHTSRKLSNPTTGKYNIQRRPVTVPANARRHSSYVPRATAVDSESSLYGINVQKDFTRSRRKLEEISKLEQDLKYRYVNKYEERRQRLLQGCKHNKSLDERIRKFLQNVDEFKKTDNPDSSLDKVLLRAKSAYIFRDSDRENN